MTCSVRPGDYVTLRLSMTYSCQTGDYVTLRLRMTCSGRLETNIESQHDLLCHLASSPNIPVYWRSTHREHMVQVLLRSEVTQVVGAGGVTNSSAL